MSVPPLHVIVPDRVARGEGFLEPAARMRRACGPGLALHLRLREATGHRLYELARTLREGAEREGGWCAVNERLDVALAAGADAVQLGHRALPVERAVAVAGSRLAVGASVHSPEEARKAADDGANHLLLGTIYPTESHPGREAAGPGLITRTLAALGDDPPPVVAIGGIDADRVAEVRAAGAAGIAVIRAVWEAERPAEAARTLLEELRRHAE